MGLGEPRDQLHVSLILLIACPAIDVDVVLHAIHWDSKSTRDSREPREKFVDYSYKTLPRFSVDSSTADWFPNLYRRRAKPRQK